MTRAHEPVRELTPRPHGSNLCARLAPGDRRIYWHQDIKALLIGVADNLAGLVAKAGDGLLSPIHEDPVVGQSPIPLPWFPSQGVS